MVSLLCFWLAVRNISVAEILGVLSGADGRLVLLGGGLVVFASLLAAGRWKLLFHPEQAELRIGTLWSITQVGQALNIAVPARVGEIARVVLLSAVCGRGKLEAAATIALEKLLDLMMLALLAVAGPIVVPLPELVGPARGVLIAAGVVAAAALVIVVTYRRVVVARLERAPEAPRGVAWSIVERLRPGLERLDRMSSGTVVIGAGLWSVIIWTASAAVNYVVLRDVGIDVSPAAALVTLAVLQLGTAVPSAPGKIGVYEYLCVLALAPFGVDRVAAVGFEITLHVVSYAPPLIIGGLTMLRYLPQLAVAGLIPFRR